MPHLPMWHTDRMVVIGDAAHAPSPSSGQGASLSIEDAVQLARCLRDAADAEQAFTAFERSRRNRVERIIKEAARINSNKAANECNSCRTALATLQLKTSTMLAAMRGDDVIFAAPGRIFLSSSDLQPRAAAQQPAGRA